MSSIIGVIVLFLFFGGAVWQLCVKEMVDKPVKTVNDNKHTWFAAVLLIGLAVRIIAATSYRGHETDMGCFIGWSDTIFKNGLSKFYISEGFHDYPPGYVYVMYVLGAIKNIFKLDGKALWLVIKMPSILADLAIGAVCYTAAKKTQPTKNAAMISAFLVFNPALIINSCTWGQVDSFLTLFCLLAVYFVAEKRFMLSFLAFAAAFMIKPQAAFFAPVLIFAVIEYVFVEDGFKRDRLIKTAGKILAAIAVMFVLFMPFGQNPIDGINVIISQYLETMGQYNYLTVNAFNLYGAFGGNWTELPAIASVLNYVVIVLVVACSGYVFFKVKDKSRYYLTAFVLVFGTYMLSVKMHERYAFPAIVMLMMVFAIKPNTKNIAAYGLVSLSQYFNMAWVLLIYSTDSGAYYKSPVIVAASFVNILLCVLAAVWIYRDYISDGTVKPVKKPTPTSDRKRSLLLSEKAVKITAFDVCAILVITAVYSAVAFYKLGNRYAPETSAAVTQNTVTADFGEEKNIATTAFYLGARELNSERVLNITYYDGDKNVVRTDSVSEGSVFSWTMRENVGVSARYVAVSTNGLAGVYDPSDKLFINEVVFMDGDGNAIAVESCNGEDAENLFDEQEYLVADKSYMAGTYFDEIYHARTAYEFIHGMSVYEWTHPPLGKVFISIGISIFGMVPFGWRFAGTVFGIFMVAVIYLFAKRVLKHGWLAAMVCLLFTFDFMHFTQTRIATIDTYVTFFIMLMYYYMYKYYNMSFYDTPLVKTLIPLGLSGLFFGLGVASKWTGAYAGAGLAVIFFITVYERFREYRCAVANPTGVTDGVEHSKIIASFKRNTLITLGFCVVMFVIVPFAIYAASYIPYMATPSGNGLKTIFENAQQMLTYHGKTVVDSTHPYSSYWYEWPIIYRPLWYFSNTTADGLKQGISAMGNPAVWWLGIGAVAFATAIAIVIPLRNRNYFGKSKALYGGIYAGFFALLAIWSYVTASQNEKLVRLFPCMMLYGCVFAGVFAVVLAKDVWFKKVSARTALFLIIGFFAGVLPWTLVLRTTYIYHFFPSVVFVVLMIGYFIKTMYDNAERKKVVIVISGIYCAAAVTLFVLFYPVLSGQPVEYQFAVDWLKWFSSWVLVG